MQREGYKPCRTFRSEHVWLLLIMYVLYDWSFENGVKEKLVPLHQVSTTVSFYDS